MRCGIGISTDEDDSEVVMIKRTRSTSKKTVSRRSKDKVFSIRMSDESFGKVSKQAKRMDMTIAEYFRYLIRLGEWTEDIYIKGADGVMEKVKAV